MVQSERFVKTVLVQFRCYLFTRWFKYDRDDLCVNKSQFVPVIFEPPCTYFCSVIVFSRDFVNETFSYKECYYGGIDFGRKTEHPDLTTFGYMLDLHLVVEKRDRQLKAGLY